MAELIELASLLIAIVLGAPIIFLSDSIGISLIVWAFGVVAGIAGSRLAARVRQKQSIREMQEWAQRMRHLYPED